MEKMIRFLFFGWGLLIPLLIAAQKEANIWYFGENAGLNFSTGTPIPLLNSAMNKDEGCSSISDSSGNLLFYTDGMRVWNKNHQQMPNGSGLEGHESSTQSALIVKKPGAAAMYHIFTTDAFFYANGLRYSVVDMSLLGGLGNVTTKNTLLHTPSTEKLTAVKHANGHDIWVIGHGCNSNVFHAYLVTSSGVSAPVNSNAGAVHTGGGSLGTQNAIGCMKVSPNGAKLALAVFSMSLVELFDFNTATGIVSSTVSFPQVYSNVYGIEFSPDNSRLYFTSDTTVYQADLSAGSAAAIVNSTQAVGNINWGPMGPGTNYLGAMQLGPDGRIYGTSFFSEYLFVIQNPNAPGIECGFTEQGVWLGGRHCYGGLPGFVQSYFSSVPQTIEVASANSARPLIYPNPSIGSVTVKCKTNTGRVQVVNAMGILVFEANGDLGNPIVLEKLPAGCYALITEAEGRKVVSRFMVL